MFELAKVLTLAKENLDYAFAASRLHLLIIIVTRGHVACRSFVHPTVTCLGF